MINKETYKRLTERDEFGNADIIGIDSQELYGNLNFGEFNLLTKALNRLAELEDKIENGTLIELPCKVGDTVYEVFKYHKTPFIQETTIEKIVITEKGLRLRLARNSVYETAISSLGKTLFLNREEAEARLKELQGEKK